MDKVPFDSYSDPQKRWALAWANSHDWGAGKASWAIDEFNRLTIRASCVSFDAHDKEGVEIFFARNMKELRDWAGY